MRQSFSLTAKIGEQSWCVLKDLEHFGQSLAPVNRKERSRVDRDLLVGKKQNNILGSAVEALEGVLGSPSKVKGLQAKVLKAGVEVLEAVDEAVATDIVVGVAEDLDVGMKSLQGVFGVLGLLAAFQRANQQAYNRVTWVCQSRPSHRQRENTYNSAPEAPPCTPPR
jgi:hypothetical protein